MSDERVVVWQGLLLDQGSQAVRVGTSAVDVIVAGSTKLAVKNGSIIANVDSDANPNSLKCFTVSASGQDKQCTYFGVKDTGTNSTSYSWISSSRYGEGYNKLCLQPDGGFVGIGITNPGSTLHIVAPTAYSIATADSSQPGNYQLTIGHTTAATGTTGLSAPFLGIGVNNTYGYFGAAYLQGVNPWFSTDVPILIQPKGGNVAIGHTQPGCKLHVYSPYAETCRLDSNASADCAVFRLTNTYGSNTNSLIFFQNANNRTVEGGASCATLRNDAGALRLQGAGGYDNANGITITSSGSVGIGVYNPGYPLHVEGYSGYGGSSFYYFNSTSSSLQSAFNYPGWPTSIYGNRGIVSGDFVAAASDIRIKKNIQLVRNALSLLDQIDIVSYDKIDMTERGADVGVIAQNIGKVLPRSVNVMKKIIPNIYSRAISHQLDQDTVFVQVDLPQEVKQDDTIKLYIIKNDKQEEHTSPIISLSQGLVQLKKWDLYDPEDKVFVYGTEVDDFLSVEKDQIGILAAAALKELVKQQEQIIQSQEQTNSSLSDRLSRVESILSQLVR